MNLTAERKMEILHTLGERNFDQEIIPYINRLNEIEGVVTISSCAKNFLGVGYIVLFLSEEKMSKKELIDGKEIIHDNENYLYIDFEKLNTLDRVIEILEVP